MRISRIRLDLLLVIIFLLPVIGDLAIPQEGALGIADERGNASVILAPVRQWQVLRENSREQAYSSPPAYDSGWITIAQDTSQTLLHNLGGNSDDYVVDMQYRDSGVDGVNQRYFGGADFGVNPAPGHAVDDRVGAYWRSLDNSSITIYRRPEDTYAEQIRVRIWIDSSPNYDSDWVALVPDIAQTLTHNLGGNPDDYVVDMQYRASGVDGVNQRYYGGADFGINPAPGHAVDDRVGAYWRSLNTTSIIVYRRPEDTCAEQVRVRIWVRPVSPYDSGWVALVPDVSLTLTHSLGGNPDDFVVDMQYRASSVDGVNLRYYGGADFGASPAPGHAANDRVGAYWRSLDSSSITVYRRPEDTYAEQVRVRIWQYFTMPPAGYWTPDAPGFDSDWVALGAGASATTLLHNLGGSPDDYLVDMQYRTPDVNGINLRYYGGADFGVHPAPGHTADDRVGAYWRSLTDSSISVFRRDEDDYAPEVRLRIWVMPAPAYDSGWFPLGQDVAQTLVHNLGGNVDDYLVDMQYRSAGDGINQRYYGGADFGAKITIGAENDRVGAYWRSLNTTSITAYRRPEDTYAVELRLRIWRVTQPAYDSGWVGLPQDVSKNLNYNLDMSAEGLLVNMLQYDGGGANGINQRHLGGADFGTNPPAGYSADDRVGAYWRSLSPTEIVVYRRPEDGFAQYVRVRVWVYDITQFVYLPSIFNSP
jgi:hypothetical protein